MFHCWLVSFDAELDSGFDCFYCGDMAVDLLEICYTCIVFRHGYELVVLRPGRMDGTM